MEDTKTVKNHPVDAAEVVGPIESKEEKVLKLVD